MRIIRYATVVALFALIVPALSAQTLHDEIALTRAQIQADRQAIIARAMGLPEGKGAAFWPLYREYRADVDKLGDRVWQLLIDFSEKYESLSDADATALLKEWLSIEKKQTELRETWAKKFSSAIGPAMTARFFQVESKLDSIIRLEATENVPLAEPKAK